MNFKSAKHIITSLALVVGATAAFSVAAAQALNTSSSHLLYSHGRTVLGEDTNPFIKDRLVKASGDAVYYYAQDGKRYVFPNQQTYNSWFRDFSDISVISDEDLASMPLGGNVRYRPGIRMIKIQTDPKVYAVGKSGVLRWMSTEEVAIAIYGSAWNTMIDDVSDAFFSNYSVGSPITDVSDFTPSDEADLVTTINENRGLATSQIPRRSDTTPYRHDAATESNG